MTMLRRALLGLRLIPPLRSPTSARPFSSSLKRSTQYRRFGDPPYRSLPLGNGGQGRQSWNQYNILQSARHPAVYVAVGGGTLYYVTHLEQVPETGRWRFMDTSVAAETAIGAESYKQIMAESRGALLPDYHPTARYVQRIATRIVRASNLDGASGSWEVHVINAPEVRNAFVLPGGKIFVYTGILPICKNEEGLAVVLGHEIAHQVARHGAERMSSLKVLMVLRLVLESLGIDSSLSRGIIHLFMTLPNSRKSESEADYIGLKLSTAACFDPREATGLWERMGAAEGRDGTKGSVNIDFLSTHPSSSKRVETVTKWAKELAKQRPPSCGPLGEQMPEFRRVMRGL